MFSPFSAVYAIYIVLVCISFLCDKLAGMHLFVTSIQKILSYFEIAFLLCVCAFVGVEMDNVP